MSTVPRIADVQRQKDPYTQPLVLLEPVTTLHDYFRLSYCKPNHSYSLKINSPTPTHATSLNTGYTTNTANAPSQRARPMPPHPGIRTPRNCSISRASRCKRLQLATKQPNNGMRYWGTQSHCAARITYAMQTQHAAPYSFRGTSWLASGDFASDSRHR